MKPFDPRARARQIAPRFARGAARLYRRIRPARWYGGIATADCCGCNLDCIFCWARGPKDRPQGGGMLLEPGEVFDRLAHTARRRGYRLLRVSGNEPTLCREHLLALLERVEGTDFRFILETNGTLIDRSYARDLAAFRRLHVRVCLKGAGEEEFAALTGAAPEGFGLALSALEYLLEAGASAHAAAMLSFSEPPTRERLRERLAAIDPSAAGDLEEEYLLLYPHVRERLARLGVRPRIALKPDGSVDPGCLGGDR